MNLLPRRIFLQNLLAAALTANSPRHARGTELPPVRRLTQGPKFHWFGYYDKWQFDPTGRYALGMEVDFEQRSPRPDDVIKVGLVDLQDGDHLPRRNNEWILNDTYPDKERLQHPYLFHVPTNRRVPLGHFHSPPEYAGEWRCDTHPRYSSAGTKVIIDSTHEGLGRQMYLIDISRFVTKPRA